MERNDDTIAAIATPPGVGAISIVRLSGGFTQKVLENIFSRRPISPESPPEAPQLKSHVASHGYIYDPASFDLLDEVVAVLYRGPRSYTGEDMVELYCHGGLVVTGEILSLLMRQGARLARKGEFTQRAFLNGRIDLTQAEAVLDIIQAKTARGSRLAVSALAGDLGRKINQVRTDLMELLTRIVAGLDFPEEIGDAAEPEVSLVVGRCRDELRRLVSTATSGKFLRQGLRLAIVGRPNAGKSSLMNALLKYERAIVTDIPGTTRDHLEEPLDINGVPVILVDTAGIRETADLVERMGIDRSTRAIESADLICLVIDLEAGLGEPEERILELVNGKPIIFVGNKIDLVERGRCELLSSSGKLTTPDAAVVLSARTGENVDRLCSEIESFVYRENPYHDAPSLNFRQSELCLRALESLEHVAATLSLGMPQDCLATDLRIAVDTLSEVSGAVVTEEIITQVFASFCIGK